VIVGRGQRIRRSVKGLERKRKVRSAASPTSFSLPT